MPVFPGAPANLLEHPNISFSAFVSYLFPLLNATFCLQNPACANKLNGHISYFTVVLPMIMISASIVLPQFNKMTGLTFGNSPRKTKQGTLSFVLIVIHWGSCGESTHGRCRHHRPLTTSPNMLLCRLHGCHLSYYYSRLSIDIFADMSPCYRCSQLLLCQTSILVREDVTQRPKVRLEHAVHSALANFNCRLFNIPRCHCIADRKYLCHLLGGRGLMTATQHHTGLSWQNHHGLLVILAFSQRSIYI